MAMNEKGKRRKAQIHVASQPIVEVHLSLASCMLAHNAIA